EDGFERRRLARPVGADDDADIALLDRDVDAVEDGRAAIAADDVGEFEQRHQAASTGAPKYASMISGLARISDIGPSAIFSPCAMTMTGSHSRPIRSMSCSMTKKV